FLTSHYIYMQTKLETLLTRIQEGKAEKQLPEKYLAELESIIKELSNDPTFSLDTVAFENHPVVAFLKKFELSNNNNNNSTVNVSDGDKQIFSLLVGSFAYANKTGIHFLMDSF